MTRQEILHIVNSAQFMQQLFTRFLQYFSIRYKFQDIELPPHYLPNDINHLLNQNFSYIVKDFLDNDNKISQLYGEINYNPHNVSLRNGPIVIYRNNDTKKRSSNRRI